MKDMRWISVEEHLPITQKLVLIAYITHHGKPEVTIGWYTPAKTLASEGFDGEVDDEYDPITNTRYLKAQWVDESRESEYHYPISGVTHWMARPDHPLPTRL